MLLMVHWDANARSSTPRLCLLVSYSSSACCYYCLAIVGFTCAYIHDISKKRFNVIMIYFDIVTMCVLYSQMANDFYRYRDHLHLRSLLADGQVVRPSVHEPTGWVVGTRRGHR